MNQKTIRCAVYTRKSSEEGLDQSFNSLHAQREACEAFVLSQKHEGWEALPTEYNDGGFSGGNMERPGLKKLLADINAGKVDTVVVYKVDRLTRSLSDFARIVDSFDGKGVSFVSVTQQFNTTSSMGRLTLNVLLSFAQFEREVTGERIRDKVAASKKKGMWMGGNIPLGYDLKDHQLLINEEEAETVRLIFREYLRLGSVFELQRELERKGLRSKHRVCLSGRHIGGNMFSRGTLYHLLSSQLYIGMIPHKDESYPGLHERIIDQKTWDETVAMLKSNGVKRVTSSNLPSGRVLLGLLVHATETKYTATHASKKGRRYMYYVAPDLPTGESHKRLPALELEAAVAASVRALLLDSPKLAEYFPGLPVKKLRLLASAAHHRAEVLTDPTSTEAHAFLRRVLVGIEVGEQELSIELDAHSLLRDLIQDESADEPLPIQISCAFSISRRGSEVRLVLADERGPAKPIPSLARVVARARDWADKIAIGEYQQMSELVAASGLTKQYVRQILRCAVLSPQSVEAILAGEHLAELTVIRLANHMPVDWNMQRARLSLETRSGLHG